MKRKEKTEPRSFESEIKGLLKGARPTKEVLRELEARRVDLDNDPEFIADFLKAQFVEDVYKAMDETGINKNKLAEKLGKSRQYVGRVLNETANFTIETMAEISCALGKKIVIRIGTSEQDMAGGLAQKAVQKPVKIEKKFQKDEFKKEPARIKRSKPIYEEYNAA
jgi:transcriptional regulator with XRE-family HTH domain